MFLLTDPNGRYNWCSPTLAPRFTFLRYLFCGRGERICCPARYVFPGFRMEPLGSVQFQIFRIPTWILPFAQMGGEDREYRCAYFKLVVVVSNNSEARAGSSF